jgi:hypothetical protein
MTYSKVSKFAGTWWSQDSDVEYSFLFHGDNVVVAGVDTNDGEELRIQDVTFDGSELRFTSICPSTSFALRHVFRSVLRDEIEHEYTRVENWQRKKTIAD